MQLTWLGTAGFKLDTSEGATLLIDPFISRPRKATPSLPIQLSDLYPIDEILLTNGRFDHAIDTPALTEQTGAIVHASGTICQRLEEIGVSRHSLECISPHKRKSLGSLKWQALPSLPNQVDSSPVLRALTHSPEALSAARALERDWPVGEVVTYQIKADGLSIIHFGSAGWIDSEIRLLQPDIALLPVECYSDANSAVVDLVSRLIPKVIIPHHWDDYFPPLTKQIDMRAFETAINVVAPNAKVHIPTIGRGFNPADLF